MAQALVKAWRMELAGPVILGLPGDVDFRPCSAQRHVDLESACGEAAISHNSSGGAGSMINATAAALFSIMEI